MKVLVVFDHPRRNSFCGAILKTTFRWKGDVLLYCMNKTVNNAISYLLCW